ncbi:MAG: hypothetical protein LBN05_01945 [Oscillospiraceae bacterium]|jgi:hypothetical protein|nr:hypothetical protein [Oscillospiraceae bacterium]
MSGTRQFACKNSKGVVCAAFGAGLLLAACLPESALVFIAAALLILCGTAFCKF